MAMHEADSASPLRRRVKYGIITIVAILGSAHLIYYFGWSDRFSKESNIDYVEQMQHPPDAIESDRGCMLLDRPFVGGNKPDYARMTLIRWTQCRPLNAIDGWSIDHCTTPGENLGLDETNSTTTASPACHPGGYFRIRRLVQPTEDGAALCQLRPNTHLALDATTNQYASSFLGPDSFRIVLLGPERLSLMQQQTLGNCIYAIPYMISRPGQFWVQKILHTYENFDALNEGESKEKWRPTYLGSNILAPPPVEQGGDYYRFQVCAHCVPVLEYDEGRGLDTCSKAASVQARQYGIYLAKTPIYSVREAVGHPYEWVPARPRCRLTPRQESFEPEDKDEDGDIVAKEKADSTQCLETYRAIYFVGDSHIRQLFSGVMQRLQGKPGPINRVIEDDNTRTILAANIEARHDYDPELKGLARHARYTLGGSDDGEEGEEAMAEPDLLDHFDTVVLGFGHEAAHLGWTTLEFVERVSTVFKSLVEIRKMRQEQSGRDLKDRRNNLKVIWLGLPAWTDDTRDEAKAVSGWRTNPRLLYWDKLVDQMIININREVGGEGMIDRLSAFDITMPFKSSTQDGIHYTQEIPVNGLSAELIHKLDLC
ncbi:hypothetical protein BG006_006932 [Podila minutissima]|uniref:Uncharacterized protein n=1 Tax=Podila minutissima TaxID=64525 RepID=A0A9P5SHV3_9FUNG|nr:hypothetical protein BG006_006932 [Podila minutissima]